MDLVEIRKKAKSRKKVEAIIEEAQSEELVDGLIDPIPEPVAAETSPQNSEPSVEPVKEAPKQSAEKFDSTTVESVSAQPPFVDETASIATVAELDPLEALFSFATESGFASEENYLQALVGDDAALDQDVQQWLTFSLGDEEYALTIDCVSEIIKPREVTDIPRVPAFIKGIISLRGIIVPVFDLNKRLNLDTRAEESSSARIIVCQEGERLAGFLVDRINQVVNVPLANVEPPPTVLSGLDRDFVDGVGRIEGKMLILLHLSNVINAELL